MYKCDRIQKMLTFHSSRWGGSVNLQVGDSSKVALGIFKNTKSTNDSDYEEAGQSTESNNPKERELTKTRRTDSFFYWRDWSHPQPASAEANGQTKWRITNNTPMTLRRIVWSLLRWVPKVTFTYKNSFSDKMIEGKCTQTCETKVEFGKKITCPTARAWAPTASTMCILTPILLIRDCWVYCRCHTRCSSNPSFDLLGLGVAIQIEDSGSLLCSVTLLTKI